MTGIGSITLRRELFNGKDIMLFNVRVSRCGQCSVYHYHSPPPLPVFSPVANPFPLKHPLQSLPVFYEHAGHYYFFDRSGIFTATGVSTMLTYAKRADLSAVR